MAKVQVLVRLKAGVLDPQGKTVEHALHSLGFEQVTGVRVGKLIELELNENEVSESAVTAMCDKLLANPVIEDYEIVEGV